jgi:murein L,D-transpeptidase YcbB/YkuD
MKKLQVKHLLKLIVCYLSAMKHTPIFLIIILFLYSACNGPDVKQPVLEKRDTSINIKNAFTELFFDSLSLENFIKTNQYPDTVANQFRSFYNARNYQFAWFFEDGPAEQAYNFLNLQNDYIGYSRDSSLYNASLQKLLDTISMDQIDQRKPLTNTERLNTELSLTLQFFRYADKAYQGDDKLNATDLKWFIPRKKVNMVAALDSLIRYKGLKTERYEPVNRQYILLKDALLKYYSIQKSGAWTPIQTTQKKFEKGASSDIIPLVKKRLSLTGDLQSIDTSALFNDSLVAAVKRFQRRYGMKEDGVIGAGVIREMNEPIQNRIRQMLINLERLRWIPAQTPQDYLLVNIPQFRLHAYDNGKLSFSMNVVVGSTQHSTVIFNGDLKYIVFSPYWNVPVSIVKNEIMPGIKKNKDYIAKHNMEITGYSGTIPIVRQNPGKNNSLGKVKFLFPNSYNIYLHDTPAKSLFGETNRAFSHGCIRLGEPKKLAEFLLRNDSTWTSAKIEAAMNSGKEKYLTLPNPVPVFIGYFTSWIDSQGELNFRNDVYGHDAKMAEQMFINGDAKKN